MYTQVTTCSCSYLSHFVFQCAKVTLNATWSFRLLPDLRLTVQTTATSASNRDSVCGCQAKSRQIFAQFQGEPLAMSACNHAACAALAADAAVAVATAATQLA